MKYEKNYLQNEIQLRPTAFTRFKISRLWQNNPIILFYESPFFSCSNTIGTVMWLWGLLTQRQETDHFNKDGECLLIHYGGFLECHLTLRGLTRCSYYFSVEFSPHLRVDEFWENNVLFRPVIIFGISLPTKILLCTCQM